MITRPFNLNPCCRLLACLVLIGSQAQAQSSNSPWVEFGQLSTSDVYVRENSIERVGDYLKIWVLYNHHNTRTSPSDEGYRSAITLFQFDCQDKKSQKLNSYGHEEAMGKGRQIDLLEKNPPWIELPPNSIGLHLIEAYCLSPKASLKHPWVLLRRYNFIMAYNNNAIELGRMNLDKGKVDIAFDIFFDLAKNDLDEDALYMLSRMTFNGQLNPEQIEQFYELQNAASSHGNGYALFNVGLMHERGLGKVKQDFKIAVQYYEKAIKEEMHDAFCNLGNIYALGLGMEQGVPRDIFKGLELLAKGAEFGSRQSAFTIGSLYGKGELIPKDNPKSVYFLTLAALLGHEQAKRVLAIFAHAHQGENFDREFDAANDTFGKIENMRKLYKCI